MIVIKVELWSARTGKKTELARMHISNMGDGTDIRANYVGETFKGRSKDALDRRNVARRGIVSDWPKQRNHVWMLVAKMLKTMGYC